MPQIEIFLNKILENYRYLKTHTKSDIAPVIKAQAYGLGALEVARVLNSAGCKIFCTATVEEALELSNHLNAQFIVFNGATTEELEYIKKARCIDAKANRCIILCANSIAQLKEYADFGDYNLTIALQIDSGINRLGIEENELDEAMKIIKDSPNISLAFAISHLGYADIPQHQQNKAQLEICKRFKNKYPSVKLSLCNSPGIFLGEEYHFDFVRPGAALFGAQPIRNTFLPLQSTCKLNARVIHKRTINKDERIGYRGTYLLSSGSKIAVIDIGYCDYGTKAHSNKSYVAASFKTINEFNKSVNITKFLPVIGLISMDTTTIDASCLTNNEFLQLQNVEVFGEKITLNEYAKLTSQCGYEALASLNHRIKRKYV